MLLMMGSILSMAQSNKTETKNNTSSKIEAYYFHLTSRCVTCKTVEAETKKDLEALYGDQVVFRSLNLEEKSTEPLAEKLKISGQTLLIVKGEKQINLTNEGFLYAVNNPAKLKAIIKQKVDGLLK
jgi:hypothetical protein